MNLNAKIMTKLFNVLDVVFMFMIICSSCGDSMDGPKIEPVLLDDSVSAFFADHLPVISASRSECFFVNDEGNTCVVINSMDEFGKLFFCSSNELPPIDFNQYTLVIGQYQMPGSGYFLTGQNIVVGSKKVELNLNVQVPEGSYPVICPLYYWGVYQKITQRAISVNVVMNDYN